jgi:DNA anti-recombination protein RmuC
MTSNAYIASDGETLMKVGKANDTQRREKQIALPMTVTVACLDESAAHRVESQLRQFVIEQGGIRHQSTIDWFKFDEQIYAVLCEFAGKLDGFEVIPVQEKGLDEEIAELRARYFQLIEEELKESITTLSHQLKNISGELQSKQQQKDKEIERVLREASQREGELREQIGELKAMLRIYKDGETGR